MTELLPHIPQEGLQRLMDRLSTSCDFFTLTITLQKTHMMGQFTSAPWSIHIRNEEVKTEHQFQYLGSAVTHNLSLDVELNKLIGKAATTLSNFYEASVGEQAVEHIYQDIRLQCLHRQYSPLWLWILDYLLHTKAPNTSFPLKMSA